LRLERVLSRLRGRIDRIDGRIAALLARRLGAVVEVGRIKRLLGLPVEDPRREEEIVSRIRGSVVEEEGKNYLGEVYRTIFRCSRVIEREE
jgi:chorismate mutase